MVLNFFCDDGGEADVDENGADEATAGMIGC
jgi:hypothetical protein